MNTDPHEDIYTHPEPPDLVVAEWRILLAMAFAFAFLVFVGYYIFTKGTPCTPMLFDPSYASTTKP